MSVDVCGRLNTASFEINACADAPCATLPTAVLRLRRTLAGDQPQQRHTRHRQSRSLYSSHTTVNAVHVLEFRISLPDRGSCSECSRFGCIAGWLRRPALPARSRHPTSSQRMTMSLRSAGGTSGSGHRARPQRKPIPVGRCWATETPNRRCSGGSLTDDAGCHTSTL